MKPLAVAYWSMITPLGEDDATINALFEQRSGFSPHPSPWKLRNTLAAVIAERPMHATSDAEWQRYLGTYVTRRVVDTLSIDIQNTRCAFVLATSYGHLMDDPGNDTLSTWAKDCLRRIGCELDPIVVGSGCSSGSDALGVAAALLDCGTIDTAIVVAVDLVTAAKRLAHSTLGTMAASNHKPFDIHRSGMLPGEAAAAVVLMRSE